jgi:hypothetical protein
VKKSTKIILIISHIITLLVSAWGVVLSIGYSAGRSSTLLITISTILIFSPFIALFYFLNKNQKKYRILGLTIYILLSPFFYMLIYEIFSSVYISIELNEILSIFTDLVRLLYITYAILYIYPFFIFYRIYKNEELEKNKETQH